MKASLSAIVGQMSPGSSILRHWPLTGGVSASIHAVEVEEQSGDKRWVVIREHGAANWKALDRDVTSNEFELLHVLFDEGFEVPMPLYLDCSGSILASPYLVLEYVDGTTSVPDQELDNYLQQMDQFLSRLHNLDPAAMQLPNLPAIEDPVQGALQYLPKVSDDKSLPGIVSAMKATTTTNRLLHGDFWPGHILWNQGRGYNTFDISDLPLWGIYVSSTALVQIPGWGLSADDEERRCKMTRVFLEECVSKLLS